jgi:hypothetical protein
MRVLYPPARYTQDVVVPHKYAVIALPTLEKLTYAEARMQSNAKHTRSNSDETQRYTVPEAARVLRITPEAVRARLSRGTLELEKTPDGLYTSY